MRFRFIEGHREVFPVRVMCSVLHINASGYYVRQTPLVRRLAQPAGKRPRPGEQ